MFSLNAGKDTYADDENPGVTEDAKFITSQ